MKKILALCLSILLIFATVPTISVYAENLAVFAVGNVTGTPGTEVTVPVSITKNPGLTAAQVKVAYDATVLEVVMITGLKFEGRMTSVGNTTFNPLSITWCDAMKDTTATGDIAIITFKIKDNAPAGTYDLTVTSDQANVFNTKFNDVPYTTVNGSITVFGCEHKNTVIEGAVDATCSSEGSTGATICLDCGGVLKKAEVIAAHYYGDWVTTKLPTETECGIQEKVCSVCGDKLTKTIPALSPVPDDTAVFSVNNVIDAPGEEVTVNVSIIKNPGLCCALIRVGYDATVFEVVKITPLMFGGAKTIFGPTTTNPLRVTWTNPLANTTETGDIATITFKIKDNAPAGIYDLTVTSDQAEVFDTRFNDVPFATVNGSITVCKHANTVIKGAVDATCTSEGSTGITRCSDCGKVIKEAEVISSIPHTWENKVSDEYKITDATCVKKATYYSSCSVCDEINKNKTFMVGSININNHAGNKITYPAVESTCIVQGNNEYIVCDDCDKIIMGSDEKNPLLPHSFDSDYDYTCSVCTYSRTPHVPTLVEKYSGTIVINSVDDLEYSCDNGFTWQSSPKFTNLVGNREYVIIQRVKATSTSQQSDSSVALNVYLKASQNSPNAPIVVQFTDSEVVLVPIENGEYSIDGINWQTSNIFKNLSPATIYIFYQRFSETDTAEASSVSPSSTIKTDKSKQLAIPNAPTVESYTEDSITLVFTDGCEYSIDGKTWQSSPFFGGLNFATEYHFYQRYKETDTTHAGKASKMLVAKTDKGTQSTPEAPVLVKVTATSIEVAAIDGYEYSIDGGITWQTSSIFTNLEPEVNYLIRQRKAETDIYYVSDISAALQVRTPEKHIPGDSDNNGIVNSRDAVLIMQYSNGWIVTIDLDNADINDDGVVNTRDYTLITQYNNGWPVELK